MSLKNIQSDDFGRVVPNMRNISHPLSNLLESITSSKVGYAPSGRTVHYSEKSVNYGKADINDRE